MKIYSKREVCRCSGGYEADTVERIKSQVGDERSRGSILLLEAQSHYMSMSRFRRERERNKRYNFGDQWSDEIVVDGRHMSEAQYIAEQGNLPLKNNLIRRLVRNVIGVYRGQSTEPVCIARDRNEQESGEIMTVALQYNMQLNRMKDLYARSMEEFLISGFVVHRKYHGWREGRVDCWTDMVQPSNFFIDANMRDIRGWDCMLVGEIHDIDFETLCGKFARNNEDYRRLSEIYSTSRDYRRLIMNWEEFGYSRNQVSRDFLYPEDGSRCRVIEIWRKESKPRYRCHDWNSGEIYKVDEENYKELVLGENARRLAMARSEGIAPDDVPLIEGEWMIDNYWYYYYVSPRGDILCEGESPYTHGSHPYVFKGYPFIDGEIHSFVGDFIDQQRYTNRLITLYDWIMRASAKGVLMVPEECIPEGVSPEEFASTWSKFNGVLIYKPGKTGEIPRQVANNSTNIGINELLNLQLKLFEDISGVNGALQGKPGYSGMSAALYNQQTQNATTSLLDLLETFDEFKRDAAYKDISNIQQYYTDRQMLNIAGKSMEYDPERVSDVEFDLSVVSGAQTPAYQAVMNEFLLEIWKGGQITLEEMLSAGRFPFADRLLQIVSNRHVGAEATAEDNEVLAQASAGANQAAVKALYGAMKT